MKGDLEVAHATVQHLGLALEFASDLPRNNKEVVLAAVSQNGRALTFVSESLRDDLDVALVAVSQNGTALAFVSPRLQSHRDVVLAAVSQVYAIVQPDFFFCIIIFSDSLLSLSVARRRSGVRVLKSQGQQGNCPRCGFTGVGFLTICVGGVAYPYMPPLPPLPSSHLRRLPFCFTRKV